MTREELEKLLAAATPGPWKIERGKRCIQGPDTRDGDPLVLTSMMGGATKWSHSPYSEYCVPGMKEGDANAALIVAAVNALPELLALREERNELQSVFDAQWGADMRAIQRWQIATGKEGTWPDRANLVVWLLERVEKLEAALKPFADEADKWANCIDKDAQEILIAHPIDVTVDSDGEIDGLNDAAFTLGDLRRARAALKETGQ